MERQTPPPWECSVCSESYNDFRAISIEEDIMCKRCVKQIFENALASEFNYPARWGGLVLHPKDFDHIIGPEFIDQYEAQEKEYQTPTSSRVYCECGEFLGKNAGDQTSNSDVILLAKCHCGKLICMRCHEIQSSASDAFASPEHNCQKSANDRKAAHELDEKNAFKGLERGIHWQLCPSASCRRKVELKDGCNHISCNCGAQFCFLCGAEAEDDDDEHFRPGGCPRYHHPDNPYAAFDGSEDAESEEESDDEGAGDSDEEDGASGTEDLTEGMNVDGVELSAEEVEDDQAAWVNLRDEHANNDDDEMGNTDQGETSVAT